MNDIDNMGLWKICWNSHILSLVSTRDLCWSESLVPWPPGLVSSKASSKSNCFGFTCNPRLSWIIGDVDWWWISGLVYWLYQITTSSWVLAPCLNISRVFGIEREPIRVQLPVALLRNRCRGWHILTILGFNQGLHIICLFRTCYPEVAAVWRKLMQPNFIHRVFWFVGRNLQRIQLNVLESNGKWGWRGYW